MYGQFLAKRPVTFSTRPLCVSVSSQAQGVNTELAEIPLPVRLMFA
jgi:hypothetical protein